MSIHRYTEVGVDRLTRQASRQARVTMGLVGVAVTAIFWLNGGARQPLVLLFPITALGGIQFWIERQSRERNRKLIQSTEIELNDDELVGRSSLGEVTVRRQDVAELKYLKDGLFVRGRTLQESIHLRPELEAFSDLVEQIERWAPSEAKRSLSSGSIWSVTIGLAVLNLGLLAGALGSDNPAIVVPCSILEASVLIGCLVWIWRVRLIPRQWKWLSVISVVPIVSILWRAYLLWSA